MSDVPDIDTRKCHIVAPEQACCSHGLPIMLRLIAVAQGYKRANTCPHCFSTIVFDFSANTLSITRSPDFYADPIKCLGLPKRVHNALWRSGVYTIADLKGKFHRSDDSIRTIRGIGDEAFAQVKQALEKYEMPKGEKAEGKP